MTWDVGNIFGTVLFLSLFLWDVREDVKGLWAVLRKRGR